MIPVYPVPCGKEVCTDPMERTAEQAKLILGVVTAALDDLDLRLKIQAETIDAVRAKAVAYLKLRLTLQQKKIQSVVDVLETALVNKLTEQAVLINSVVPGAADTDFSAVESSTPPPASNAETLYLTPIIDGAEPMAAPEVLGAPPSKFTAPPEFTNPAGTDDKSTATGLERSVLGKSLATTEPGASNGNAPQTQAQAASVPALQNGAGAGAGADGIGDVLPGMASVNGDGAVTALTDAAQVGAAFAAGGIVRVCIVHCDQPAPPMAADDQPTLTAVDDAFPAPEYDDWEEDWE